MIILAVNILVNCNHRILSEGVDMISVIMLTFNREMYVGNMIVDILGQTYADFEYVIVNNGSTDGTEERLAEYAKSDQRIRVLKAEGAQSIGRGRNLGLQNAKGDLVAFVDDDDRAAPDFLEFLVTLLREHEADISMCGATEGDGETRNPQCVFQEKMVLTGEEALRLLLGRKYIRAGMPTKLYRREILERFPFEEVCKNEDIHTQYRYLTTSKKVVIHGMDKYYITRHDGNVSGFTSNAAKWDARTMRDYLTAFHNRTTFIRMNASDVYELALYSEWSYMLSMVEKIEKYHLEDCLGIGNALKCILKKNREQFLNMPEIKEFEREWMERYI